jgi:hypothetical protein
MPTVAAPSAADALLRLIASGQVDPYLRSINEAVVARWKTMDILKSVGFTEGDRVHVNSQCRSPRYRGQNGVVIGKEGKWILVRLDHQFVPVKFSPSLLDVLPNKINHAG